VKIGSILAIYFLFFCFSAFALLPFGVRTSDEAGEERVPGQAESAPHRFDLPRHLGRAAILALVFFAIYYANWQFGWVTVDDLDFYNPPVNAAS
jgi:predicted secreted protein